MDQRPKYKTETISYVEENIGIKLMDIGLRENFVNLAQKSKELKTKINQWCYIKLQSFYTAKETASKNKRATNQIENIFANNSSDRG